MVKAKDLLESTKTPNRKTPEEAEDQVTAAYESINKRLESLKKGKFSNDDSDEEEEDPLDREDNYPADEIDPLDKDEELDEEKEDKVEADEDEIANAGSEAEEKPESDEEKSDDEDEPVKTSSKFEESAVDTGIDDDKEEIEPEETFAKREGEEETAEPRKFHHSEVEGEEASIDEQKDELNSRQESRSDMPEETLDDLASEESDTHIPPLRSQTNNPNVYSPDVSTQSEHSFQRTNLGGERNSFSNRYEGNSPRRQSSSKLQVLILALIGLAVIGATVYLLKSQFKIGSTNENPSSSPVTQTPEPTTTPVPTPTPPTIDRAKYKIRVLNGTSKVGLAATVSAKLKDLGYQIDKTANATNSSFETTQVRAKSSAAIAGLIDQIVRDLSPDYSAASSSAALKPSDASDAEVILGQN